MGDAIERRDVETICVNRGEQKKTNERRAEGVGGGSKHTHQVEGNHFPWCTMDIVKTMGGADEMENIGHQHAL